MTKLIPLTDASPNFTQIVTLDGVQYTMTLLWNDRVNRWFMSLDDLEGNRLITGRKLCAMMPWASHETIDGVPPGKLWVVTTGDSDDDPKLTDLGNRVHLMYVEEAS